jgi:hypothetical protein
MNHNVFSRNFKCPKICATNLIFYHKIYSLKLSPNLRKRPKKSKKDPTPLPVNEEQEKEKLSNLIGTSSK